ncbi:MAG: DUF4097 domain-containing protein [bacterium]|nr:DUF4097 domain-containing protein [bacterium]
MKKSKTLINLIVLFSILISGSLVYSQEKDDQLKAKLEDPSKEGFVYITWRNGDITIRGRNTDEVEVEIMGRQKRPDRDIRGMRRVYDGDSVELEQDGNRINIDCQSQLKQVDADIFVPENAKLIIENSLNGDVRIEDFKGEIEIKTLNGDIEVRDAAGPVDIYSTNGDIVINYAEINFDREITLRTLNNAIDLTLPSDAKATIYMKTNDAIYVDEEFSLDRSSRRSGRYSRSTKEYSLNGGGVEMNLSSLNGNIYIRKGR